MFNGHERRFCGIVLNFDCALGGFVRLELGTEHDGHAGDSLRQRIVALGAALTVRPAAGTLHTHLDDRPLVTEGPACRHLELCWWLASTPVRAASAGEEDDEGDDCQRGHSDTCDRNWSCEERGVFLVETDSTAVNRSEFISVLGLQVFAFGCVGVERCSAVVTRRHPQAVSVAHSLSVSRRR